MSDIVERMRIAARGAEIETHLDYDPGFAEAADEIEAVRHSRDAFMRSCNELAERVAVLEKELSAHGVRID